MSRYPGHKCSAHDARRLLLTFGIAFGALISQSAADTRVVKVGAARADRPSDHDRGPRAFFREIVTETARRVNVELEWTPAAWPEQLHGLSDGSIDMLGLIALTEKRRPQFHFSSEPLFVDWGRVYARRDTEIGQVLDLDGKTVAVPRDDVYFVDEHGLRHMLGDFGVRCKFVEYDSYADVAQAVAKGDADAGLLSRLFGARRGEEFGLAGTPILVNPRSIHWAFRKDMDPAVVAAFDRELRILKATPDSVYHTAKTKWLEEQPGPVTPAWVVAALRVGGALLVLFAAASVASRIQVRRRTRELARRNEELLASDERLRRVIEHMPVMMNALDESGMIVAWNRECELVSGYSAEEIVRNPRAMELLYPDAEYRERILREWNERGRDYYNWEWELTRKNGSVRTIAWSSVAIRAPIPGWHTWGIGVDVTESSHARAALRASERRLKDLVDAAEDCIFVKDRDARYIQVNPAMERLLGRPAREIIGQTDLELFGRETAEFIGKTDERVFAGESVEAEDQIDARGATRIFQVIKVPIYDNAGDATTLLGIARDVTERKRAEDEVRRRGCILASLSEAAQLLIATDRWDEHVEQMLGSLGESTGACRVVVFELDWSDEDSPQPNRRGCWTDPFAAEQCGAAHCANPVSECRGAREWLAELKAPGGAAAPAYSVPASQCNYRKDPGNFRTLLLPVYRGTTLWGCLSLYRCHQEDHWSDLEIDALRTAADLIGAAVKRDADAEGTLQLESQLRHAQKMDAVGQLAGGVAHDFNNILTAILGNVELALDATQDELPGDDQLIEGLRQVEIAANRAASLTRQLLVFSRRDVSKSDDLNLNETLTQLESMLRRLIKENVDLNVTCSPNAPLVRADVGQIEQVIVNLVVNAVDAMKGGGSLTLETGFATVDADQAAAHPGVEPGRFATLSVRDTGEGMDKITRDRAFEPFYTTKSVGQGAGLGLSIVHGIVRKSDGFITVESEPGRGASITIYLPACEPKAGPVDSASTSAAAPGGTEAVLLCEDDEAVRELAERMLQEAGYSVITASDGAAALALAKANKASVDLLITDVVMPQMSGKQLADLLRAERPNLRTLYMSGYTSDLLEGAGVAEQSIDLLHKPFNRSELLSRVRTALDRRNAATAHSLSGCST